MIKVPADPSQRRRANDRAVFDNMRAIQPEWLLGQHGVRIILTTAFPCVAGRGTYPLHGLQLPDGGVERRNAANISNGRHRPYPIRPSSYMPCSD